MKKASVIPVINKENDDSDIYQPINYEVQKAIWISYIDLAPMLTGKTESEFEKNFDEACENISKLGCNTIYVHVRPFGDALYNSKLYPTSQYVTGQVGELSDFDPLADICGIAHEYDLSVHAWINPLRLENEENFQYISDSYLIKEWYNDDNDYVETIDGDTHLWLNPAYEEVRNLISGGTEEIAKNYEIDGIHYDDYFYPTTDESFDAQCFSEMSDGKTLSQWRLDNISLMVGEIYQKVKKVNPEILVGASPQGNIENNYAYMFADVKKWCSQEGYIDYITPQIYYGYNNSVKPYAQTLKTWESLVTNKNIKLVSGLAVYKIGVENEFTDSIGIISQQAQNAFDDNCGVALYAYNNLFLPDDNYIERVKSERLSLEKLLNSL